jgi:hypothetical protein
MNDRAFILREDKAEEFLSKRKQNKRTDDKNENKDTKEIGKILIYKRNPIKFLLKTDNGLLITNWKFSIKYCRHNKKPLAKFHILIRTPLLCFEHNNGGTWIGNKHVIWFRN